MDQFEKILKRYSEALVVKLVGNYGDELLWMGCEKKLKELGLSYQLVRPEEEMSKFAYYFLHASEKLMKKTSNAKVLESLQDVVLDNILSNAIKRCNISEGQFILVHGTGTIGDLVPTKILLLRRIFRYFAGKTIILGPQSYWFPKTDINRTLRYAQQEVHLFAREKYSFQLLRSLELPENIHIHLSPDTAFYLQKDDFNSPPGTYDLVYLRDDHESVISTNLKNAFMCSLQHSVVAKDATIESLRQYVETVKGAKRIFTDRLHVGILGVILEKRVIFFPNVYHKNIGVYEYSLRKYSNVRFCSPK